MSVRARSQVGQHLREVRLTPGDRDSLTAGAGTCDAGASLGPVRCARLVVAQWDLGRAEHYSWRAGFVLMQLTTLLAREARFSLLAVPDLLDAVMDDVIPRVPTHARLLVRTDLPGLHRHIGGHGADDGAIERVLATFVFGRDGDLPS